MKLNSKLTIFSIRNLSYSNEKLNINYRKRKEFLSTLALYDLQFSLTYQISKNPRNSISHPPIQRPEKPITNVHLEKEKK